MIFFTSANLAYLAKARLLASSVKAHMPDSVFVLALLDDENIVIDSHSECFDEVLYPSQLQISNFESWIFAHNVVEACTAQKGRVLSILLAKYPNHDVVYLDPDIKVYSKLLELEDALTEFDVVLTPHVTIPESTTRGIEDNELSALQHGAFNLGFIGVKNSARGAEFASWWDSRLQRYCFDEKERGLFTDQKWIDLVPGLFEGVGVLRHPGYNIATWNILQREIMLDPIDSKLLSNGLPLRFIHFSGYDSGAHGEVMNALSTPSTLFRQLSKEYSSELACFEASTNVKKDWIFSYLQNGTKIRPEWRRTYRDTRRQHSPEENPFNFPSSSFINISAEELGHDLEIPLSMYVTNRDLWGKDIFIEGVNGLFPNSDSIGARENPRISYIESLKFVDSKIADLHESSFHNLKNGIDTDLPTVAYMSHGLGGGVDMHIDSLTKFSTGKANIILIHPLRSIPKVVKFSLLNSLDKLEHFVSYPDVVGVSALLKSLGVDTIHIHHAMGQESLSKGLALSGDFRIIVTIHDYYFLTPNWTFSKSKAGFYEFPKDLSDLDFINREYNSELTSTWGSAKEWISMLNDVDLIIYPSQSAFRDFSGFVTNANHLIALHPEFPYPELYPERNSDNNADIDTLIRVGVFGDLGPHKGTELLKQIIRESPKNITFVGIGRANPDVIELFDEWYGTYEQYEIVRLLHVNSVDVLLLPMQIHETYSYSLSEALRSGLRIVASNIPIFNERAGHRRKVSLVNLDADPNTWINALLFEQKLDSQSSANNSEEFKSRNFYKCEYWKHIYNWH